MKRIGILSDTHSWWDEKYARHFAGCDEIWHAGDIGSELVINRLEEICPVRAVYGNIDGQEIRHRFGEVLRFTIEECTVLMKHIGGYPGKYEGGKVITGMDAAEETGATVYHAGTKAVDGSIVTAGGRVLGVTATADTLAEAVALAYKDVEKITFEKAFYRRDIGRRALEV